MSTQASLLAGMVLLVILIAPIQFFAVMRMRSDINNGFRELGLRHGAEVATTVAMLVFAGYAMIPALVAKGDPLAFHDMQPFKPFYGLVKGLLRVPSDHTDLKYLYVWIWSTITFIVPALFYGAVNAKVSTMIWDKISR